MLHPIKTPSLVISGVLAVVMTIFVGCSSSDATSVPDPCENCGAETGQILVTNRAARACQLLVEATDGRVASVEFGDGVIGEAIPEGDRAGVSIVSNGAEPLPEIAGTVRFDGSLKVVQSACFDEAGNRLDGNGITL